MRLLRFIIAWLPTLNGLVSAECSFQVQKNVTSRSISLSWSLPNCERKVDEYEVILEHVAWLACRFQNERIGEDGNKKPDTQVKNIKTKNSSISLSELDPYSEYKISIIAWDLGVTYNSELVRYEYTATTESDLPQTRPRASPKGDSEARQHGLTFHWQDIDPEDCSLQNGKADGFLVELRGIDTWDHRSQLIKTKTVQGHVYQIFDLKPYTRYELRVYCQNFEELVNKNLYLKLEEVTLPTQPESPTNVTATLNPPHSVHLSWLPGYPRTGEISHFELRNGTSLNQTAPVSWNYPPVRVGLSHKEACSDQNSKSEKICYVVSNLKAATTYHFQVRTKNKEVVDYSSWSSDCAVMTPDLPTSSSTTTLLTSTEATTFTTVRPEAQNPDQMTILVAVIVVMISLIFICIVGIVFRYRWKLRVLKERLQMEQTINMSRMDSVYSSQLGSAYDVQINSTLDSTFRTRKRSEMDSSILTNTTRIQQSSQELNYMSPSYLSCTSTIQSRRLPEPPPDRAPHPGLETGAPHPGLETAATTQGYDVPVPQGYLNMSLGRRKRSHQLQGFVEDVAGYSRTNFRPDQDTRFEESAEECVDPVCIPAESYGTAPTGESESSKQNLLKYERPDLLPSVRPERASTESDKSTDSHKHLLHNNQNVQ